MEDEETRSETEEPTDCVKINYNRRNKAKSVTCTLGATTLNSYMNCFNDIKSLTFYKKLIAEYIGNFISCFSNLYFYCKKCKLEKLAKFLCLFI